MATYGYPSSHFPTKMSREDFAGKKVVVAGLLMVRRARGAAPARAPAPRP